MTSLSLGPHYTGRLGTVLHFAHCVYSQSSSVASLVSASYPSAKQVLSVLYSTGAHPKPTTHDAW